MKYCETLYLNCESDFIPKLHNSDVIRLDNHNYHAYGIFICFLGQVFFKATRMQENDILDKPYSVSIVIPKIEKFKDEDVEDNLTRLKYIANNFVPPEKGIIISIYEAPEHKKIITPFDFYIMWPYKRQWQKDKTDDYVAVGHQDNMSDEAFKNTIDVLNEYAINYKLINYTMKLEEVFDILLNCKFLCSWTGGPYFIAGGLNVPTLGYGNNPLVQVDCYHSHKLTGNKLKNRILRTHWGEAWTQPGRIVHFNNESGVHQKEQSVVKNMGNVITPIEKNILIRKLMDL